MVGERPKSGLLRSPVMGMILDRWEAERVRWRLLSSDSMRVSAEVGSEARTRA